MKKSSEKVYRRRQKLKLKALDYMGGKCQICGYNKCTKALVFHHLNPEEKEFNVSRANKSWERIKKELEKCILVCSNCHAEIHDDMTHKFSFDDIYKKDFKIKDKEFEFNQKICDLAEKYKTTKEKIIESRVYKRKVERPTREDFFKIFEENNRNYTKTGKYFGVSDNAIRNWIEGYERFGF